MAHVVHMGSPASCSSTSEAYGVMLSRCVWLSLQARGSAERGEGKGATSGDDSEEGNGRSRGGGVVNVSGGLFDQASAHEAE
eukprot:36103-Eustigmatos_ZCMA.PRE.1